MPTITRTYPIIAPDGSTKMITEQIEVSQSELNRDDLTAKASQALTANATYLAIASPSVAQNTAQIQRLTREVNAILRLMLNQVDDTVGT